MQWLIPYNFKDTTVAISPCNSADHNIYISTSTHIIAFLNLHVVEVQSATSWLPLLKFGFKPRTERKGTGSNCCGRDTQPEFSVACADSDRAFWNSYENGTSISRKPRKLYETAEVGHSQLDGLSNGSCQLMSCSVQQDKAKSTSTKHKAQSQV